MVRKEQKLSIRAVYNVVFGYVMHYDSILQSCKSDFYLFVNK